MSTNFQLGSVYSFDMWPVALLGANFKNATVTGILDEKSARRFISTRELHANIFPTLPVGTPNNPAAYNYLQITTQQGVDTVIGIAWIKDASVQLILSTTYKVLVGDITASDLPRLRNALLQSGFNNISIDLA